ncbi:putative vitamin h transporter protein [Neofusicoccum parvum UCRNP2]|uniref:Putative vitamin h transporter protein n=1 Tax=Botryosphaeria parva (strain UCR-NP2) TaxID=1287680 RepID=R1EYY6_BOTPV|nr:putative vitamin h transporter protein [Neofusicoccum parvum UCRNP2]
MAVEKAHERKLLFKLDLSILIFACLCFFTKYLDQSNINNAYTSGMKEELELYGNELNYFNVCYFIAYVIAQIPMLLLISRPKLWLFIIDGIFTIPVALAGYIIFPGIPESPKPIFLTTADIALAKARMHDEQVRPSGKINLDVFKRSLRRWHIYVFVFCYICMIISYYPASYMNLWLKSEHYSVPQINKLPTALNAITIVSSWLGTTLAAIYPAWTIYTGAMASCVFSCICMTVWRIPNALKFVACLKKQQINDEGDAGSDEAGVEEEDAGDRKLAIGRVAATVPEEL